VSDRAPDADADLGHAAARLRVLGAAPQALSQLERASPAALAYLGDAVYETHVRARHLLPPKRLETYHQHVVAEVRAEHQARQLDWLEPHLTEAERTLVRRGRNASSGRPRRLSRRVYQRATGLEALMGYLFLQDPQRLSQLLALLERDRGESQQL